MSEGFRTDIKVLTERELEVLRYASQGYTYDMMAEEMGIGRRGVVSVSQRAQDNMFAGSLIEAVYKAAKQGLI